jgi:hypothetical protein
MLFSILKAVPTRHGMKPFWLTAAIFCAMMVSANLRAQSVLPAEVDSIFGLRLPPEIAGAQREAVTNYEKANPGLGYSVRYRLPAWTTDIYIYDLKRPAIPDDPMSAAVRTERDHARNDVFLLAKRGNYRNVTAEQDYIIADASGRTRFVCSALTYFDIARNIELDSYLCLSGWHGKFVKFRMSTPHNPTSAAASRRFIEAWIGVLWPSA